MSTPHLVIAVVLLGVIFGSLVTAAFFLARGSATASDDRSDWVEF